jgi:anti-sigma B factor antagonist
MQLTTMLHPNGLLVRVEEGRIDAASAIRFKDTMREIVEGTVGRVILDLGQVQFLDSSGLGAVVSVMKILAPARSLELARVTPTVARVLQLTRMDRVMRIHDDLPADLGQPGVVT